MFIRAETTFEEIAESYPYLIQPLLEMGVKVIACGDVIWGTLGEELERLGLAKEEIIQRLNSIAEQHGGPIRNLRLDI